MTKLKFLLSLHDKLSGLPQQDVEERLNFYSEMIEDRIEEGLSEEEAVAQVGTVDEIAAQIAADIPASKNGNENTKRKRQLKAWEIVLLALGSPIWLSLLIAAFAVAFSLYAVLWSVIISLWAAFAGVTGGGIGIAAVSIIHICHSDPLPGIALIAAGIVCVGLAIFLFYGCHGATKATVLLTKKFIFFVKNKFTKKEEA